MNDFDILTNLGRTLKILYVEDEKSLQDATKAVLEHFFGEIVTANNGEEGIQKYRECSPDIVITDIQMPKKDGLELIQEIKKINPSQRIIITSAYGDENTLLEIIELGIDSFVQKPVEQKRFISTLIDISSLVKDDSLEHYYKKKLKNVNKKLEQKNSELEKVVSVLENKLKQLACPLGTSNVEDKEKVEEERFYENLIDGDLDELKEIESDIDYIVSGVLLNNTFSKDELKNLSTKLTSYAVILTKYYSLSPLAAKMKEFSNTLEENMETEEKKIVDAFTYAESFSYVLGKWRKNTLEDQAIDKKMYERSMLCDLAQIVSALEDKDIENEVEFFI